MKIYGIVGKNINYTISPDMHNAAFRHFGIDAEYRVFDVEEKELAVILDAIALCGKISGVNVTVPYKIKMKELLESRKDSALDDDAKLVGAVNTVTFEKGKTVGYNTDGRGFFESLSEDTGFNPKSKSIFIFGAGGAGSAVAFYLASHEWKPAKLFIYDTDKKRAAELSQLIGKEFGPNMGIVVEDGAVAKRIASSDLVVNATPLGTKKGDLVPFDVKDMKSGAVLYDLVYARDTEICQIAREKGMVVSSGLGMLVNQGAVAFRIWTGKPFDEIKKVMREAASKSVGARFPRPEKGDN